jgi:hypothetical protein
VAVFNEILIFREKLHRECDLVKEFFMGNYKDKKILIILNVISLICGALAIIMFFVNGVDFRDPILWVMCLIVLSSITSLVKLNLKPKNKKSVKK